MRIESTNNDSYTTLFSAAQCRSGTTGWWFWLLRFRWLSFRSLLWFCFLLRSRGRAGSFFGFRLLILWRLRIRWCRLSFWCWLLWFRRSPFFCTAFWSTPKFETDQVLTDGDGIFFICQEFFDGTSLGSVNSYINLKILTLVMGSQGKFLIIPTLSVSIVAISSSCST